MCFAALACLVIYALGKAYFESQIPKPCQNSYLPNLHLCTPRDFTSRWNLPIEEYDWKKSSYIDSPEGGNKLILMIPRTILPVLPLGYSDWGSRGNIQVTLGVTNLSTKQRQTQFEHYQNNTVFKSDDKGAFIYCIYYAHEAGKPAAKRHCFVVMDWDEKITNPRIELSFSIAPDDFDHWYENAEKVRALLRVYSVTPPST